MLPVRVSQIRDVSELEDIHRYSGKVMRFMGRWEEAVRVWEHLLTILQLQKPQNRSRSSNEYLANMPLSETRGHEVKIREANVYDSHGNALSSAERLSNATSKLKKSLRMRRKIFGDGKPHSDIAMSLNNLGNGYLEMGKLDKALKKHKRSLKMRRAIHGHQQPHPHIAMSLNNLGIVYQKMGNLDKALEK